MATKFKEGCYFDGARGIYIGEEVIALAESEGMPEVEEENRTPDGEFYCEAWDDAENWLNSHCAEDGYYFGSSEGGDWGYWKVEEEEE